MKFSCLVVFALGLFLPSISSRNVNFFRKDYTYLEEFDAFYKVHWDDNGFTWDSAFSSCYAERATLFYPKTENEWKLVKNLTEKMTEAPNVTDIFVGVHDKFDLGEFLTVDGQTTPYPMFASGYRMSDQKKCVTMNTITGVFQVDDCTLPETPLLFVCKRVNTLTCPTIDPDYKYVSVLKKCYKLNNMRNTWMEAMKTCFMEGGRLAVIENQMEADIISGIIRDTARLENDDFIYVGVFKFIPNDELYTIKGKKISDVYNNAAVSNTNDYDCGAVLKNNPFQTTTVSCDIKLPFICEMDVVV